MSEKKKIGIIVQRYGAEVNGGAEVHARMIAEKLSAKYDVTVLTSQAIEYQSWKPEYAEGESELNSVKIIRFANQLRKSEKEQRYYRRKITNRLPSQRIYRLLNSPGWWLRLFPEVKIAEQDNIKWLEAQGPAMPGLLTYLKQHQNNYAAYIFFTALYYPSAMGVITVPGKSIFVPTVHDEKPMYFPIYQKVMSSPSWILFNTTSEMEFSEKMFDLQKTKKQVVGVGIELSKETVNPDKSILSKLSISSPYIIYVGRIDKNKGCDVMIKYFLRYIGTHKADINLVLVGKAMMEIPTHPSVIHTGFVDDNTKTQLMLQAHALIIPSFFESLSLVLLESFACGVPAIANGKTEVLKEHIDKSDGGWVFYNYTDFANALNEIINNESKRIQKAANGFAYVKNNYSWDKVLNQFDEAIDDIENANA